MQAVSIFTIVLLLIKLFVILDDAGKANKLTRMRPFNLMVTL